MKTIKPDSAGVLYPYIKDKWNTQFRVEAELDEPVKIDIVKAAVKDLQKRFPTYFVKLVRSKQIFLLEFSDDCNVVFEEEAKMFQPFDFDNEIPFRVLVHKNRLAIEVFHIISDAHAGMVFFKTLLAHYYKLQGEEVQYGEETLCPYDEPTVEEMDDPFLAIYKQGKAARGFPAHLKTFAYQYCPKNPHTDLSAVILRAPANEIRALAKKHNTTIGVYLASVYLYAFYLFAGGKTKRDIRISMPIDMRKRFPSKTMRNFSLFSILGFSPEKDDWTLEKIIEHVSKQLEKQVRKERLLNDAYTNVVMSKSILFDIIPVPVKKFIFCAGSEYMGERLFGSTLSNLGLTDVPDGIKQHVEGIRMLLGEDLIKQINLSTTTFNGFMDLCFTSRVEDQSVQNIFANIIKESGVDLKRIERKAGSKDYIEIT